jgi:ubiquinone biosynthesis protein Coq4
MTADRMGSAPVTTAPEPEAAAPRILSATEARYMTGGIEPVTSSVLVSSSKYLNNPYYRDAFCQFALRRPGTDLPPTYLIPNMIRALAETRDDREFAALIAAEKAAKPDFAAWLDRRRLTTYVPDEMRHHAAGTLGATIREFVETSGMEMNFMKAGLQPRSDMEYLLKRRVPHHDIEHMVTGFGPNALGEAALAVMNNAANYRHFSPALAQYLNEATMWVTTTSLYRTSLHAPALMADMYGAWAQALAAGAAIRRPLMLVDWEDYLDWPVDDIAADLGFARGPGTAWDYSSDVVAGRSAGPP